MHHDIPHGTEHTHGTQDNPHSTHDIPHDTEHPHSTQNIPTFIMISPTVLDTPTVLKISPTVIMISPMVLNTPMVLSTPNGTAHTLYRVIISVISTNLSHFGAKSVITFGLSFKV